ncbi:MAG TPA: NDP-sugar synthase [Solirubrobacterales bacterium]|nr:NDP-sugar synthase [Solirubrobacterales bacterium]
MQAVILAGGEGTRLRPLTLTRPKPAIPLVDRPFIRYVIDWVVAHGADEVLIACGFGADAVRDSLARFGAPAVEITYLEEAQPLGTAGPLGLAADQGLLEDRFLCLNGDVLADLDLGALIRSHAEHGGVASIALHPVEDPSSYGLVRRAGGPSAPGAAPSTAEGEVEEFLEKPDPEHIDTDEVSAGAYVLEREIVEWIPRDRAVSIEHEVFPRLVGGGLYGHRLEGYWMDIGTPERYLQATRDILEGRVRTEAGARLDSAGLLVAEGARVDPAATVRPPALIESEAEVGPGSTIGAHAVIGGGSEIGAEAIVSSAVVMGDCRVGSGAELHDAILAPGVTVGEGARLGGGAVIGEGAEIEPGAEIGDGARLAPGEVVR